MFWQTSLSQTLEAPVSDSYNARDGRTILNIDVLVASVDGCHRLAAPEEVLVHYKAFY